jgi:hypothetical protein
MFDDGDTDTSNISCTESTSRIYICVCVCIHTAVVTAFGERHEGHPQTEDVGPPPHGYRGLAFWGNEGIRPVGQGKDEESQDARKATVVNSHNLLSIGRIYTDS